MRAVIALSVFWLLACAGSGGDIGDAAADGPPPDSECVRYQKALIACAE